MRNITITLDEDTARLARVRAAERDLSVSRYVGELVRADIRGSGEYEEAYRAWRAEKPFALKGPWKPYPKREDLYDRPILRRR
jgi:hypothetical protein